MPREVRFSEKSLESVYYCLTRLVDASIAETHVCDSLRLSPETIMESRDTSAALLWAFVLALGLYVGSYFLAVRPGAAVWFTPSGLKTSTLPDYRGLPPRMFLPMHYLDRTFLRPKLWGPSRVWTVRGQNTQILTGGQLTNLTWNPTTGGAALSNVAR
jgi:hypothetical protein